MAYMTQLADGRVVPQTTLPEHLWKGKPVKPKKTGKTARQKFCVEVTESYHATFDIEAGSEKEARELVEKKLSNGELTCQHGMYSRVINHVYLAEG